MNSLFNHQRGHPRKENELSKKKFEERYGLRDADKAVKAGGVTLTAGGSKLPTLTLVKISSDDDLVRLDTWVEENAKALGENYRTLAEAVRDPRRMVRQAEEVDSAEEQIFNFLTKHVPENRTAEREDLIAAAMREMMRHYLGSTGDGEEIPEIEDADVLDQALRRVATFGWQLDYFVRPSRKTDDRQIVRLKVTGSDGRWNLEDMTCHHPGSRGTIPFLRNQVEKLRRLRKTAHDEAVKNLAEGTVPFAEAFGHNMTVETTLYVPDEGRLGGGHVRIEVDGKRGVVRPIRAVGRCQRFVDGLVEGEVAIPIASLNDERFSTPNRVQNFGAMAGFHGLIRRGMKRAAENAADAALIEEMRTAATGDARELLLSEEPGPCSAVLRHDHWKVEEKKEDDPEETYTVVYHRVNFLVERNEANEFRVANCLPKHASLFEKCREWKRLEEQSYPLREMLGIIRRKLERANGHGNDETDEVEATPEHETDKAAEATETVTA